VRPRMPYLARRLRPILSLTAAGFLASGGFLAVSAQPPGPVAARSHSPRHERPLPLAARVALAGSRGGVSFGGTRG
jgi:hypothetical protein